MAGGAEPRYRRVDGCVDRWFRDEVLLIAPGGVAHTLEGAAAAVWWALATPATSVDIRERVAAEWALDSPLPGDDVDRPLADLVASGLVLSGPDHPDR